MLSPGTVALFKDLALVTALVGSTFAWDGMVRQHIILHHPMIGRFDLRGRTAVVAGVLALVLVLGASVSLFALWRHLLLVCRFTFACTVRTGFPSALLEAGSVILLIVGFGWTVLWFYRVRGPDGHLRRPVGPGTFHDEGELAQRVQKALAEVRQPPIDDDLLIRITRAVEIRITGLVFQPKSPYIEQGKLATSRFVDQLITSEFSRRFPLPHAQLRTVLTAIIDYYEQMDRQALQRRQTIRTRQRSRRRGYNKARLRFVPLLVPYYGRFP